MAKKIITIDDDRIEVLAEITRTVVYQDTGETKEESAGFHGEARALGDYPDADTFEAAKADLLAIHLGADTSAAVAAAATAIAKAASADPVPVSVDLNPQPMPPVMVQG